MKYWPYSLEQEQFSVKRPQAKCDGAIAEIFPDDSEILPPHLSLRNVSGKPRLHFLKYDQIINNIVSVPDNFVQIKQI